MLFIKTDNLYKNNEFHKAIFKNPKRNFKVEFEIKKDLKCINKVLEELHFKKNRLNKILRLFQLLYLRLFLCFGFVNLFVPENSKIDYFISL